LERVAEPTGGQHAAPPAARAPGVRRGRRRGALAVMDNIGERYYEAELYRLKGELLLAQQGNGPLWFEAEGRFQHALAVARSQQAKSLELRAAMSLARLWQRQGQHAEAHALLAEVYGWFTEGFDTQDVREAKALLQELQRGRAQ